MPGRLYIGTSGWMYPSWGPLLYPGVPRTKWLAHAARVFTGLEVNATFYRQQSQETFRRWCAQTPPGFRFGVKAHRFITHYKRLRDVRASVDLLRGPALGLGDKLAAVVWQLPSDLVCDRDRLQSFLAELARWPETRHALEMRHRSWFTAQVAGDLRAARVAVCISDAPDFPMWLAVTTDLVYVRLHGHTRKYASSYSRPHLERWADRARIWQGEGREVHIYFDNDAEGAAVRNACTLLDLMRARPAAPPRARASLSRAQPGYNGRVALDSQLVDWFHRTRGIPCGAELADVGTPARHAALAQIEKDLRWLGIRKRFHFVWTAVVSGVEEGQPSVVLLMRTLVRADDAPAAVHQASERVLGLGVDGVARHEIGHALLFQRPRAARDPDFRRLFGDVDAAYRVGDPVDEVVHRMTNRGGLANPRYRRVVSLYAATHPHERFAEAVRIALSVRADEEAMCSWARRHRTAPIVVEQLLWAGRWLRSYGKS